MQPSRWIRTQEGDEEEPMLWVLFQEDGQLVSCCGTRLVQKYLLGFHHIPANTSTRMDMSLL